MVKVILVTGASSGIGLSVAKMLAEQGHIIYAASRRGQKGQKFQNGGELIPVMMDVCDDVLIDKAVRQIIQEQGRIDGVIHSAGMGIAGAAEDTPIADVKLQMQVNYFGVLQVNAKVLPQLRKSKGFCVIVGSVAGIVPIPFQSQYSASKFALEAYAQALSMEMHPFSVQVCLVDPGDTKTGFTNARKFTLPANSPYDAMCKKAVSVMEKDEQNGDSPDVVARAICKAVTKNRMPIRVIVGMKYRLIVAIFQLLPKRMALSMVADTYKVPKKNGADES